MPQHPNSRRPNANLNRYFPWHAVLSGCRCPYAPCPGQLKPRRFEQYEIAGGTIVPEVTVNVCQACNAHLIAESEWTRITKGSSNGRSQPDDSTPAG